MYNMTFDPPLASLPCAMPGSQTNWDVDGS